MPIRAGGNIEEKEAPARNRYTALRTCGLPFFRAPLPFGRPFFTATLYGTTLTFDLQEYLPDLSRFNACFSVLENFGFEVRGRCQACQDETRAIGGVPFVTSSAIKSLGTTDPVY